MLKMNNILIHNITKKDYCSICHKPLGKYSNNGAPLVDGKVCNLCNNTVILPYRYFLATYAYNNNALLIRDSKATLIKASDNKFKRSDVELYLGKGVAFVKSSFKGLCVAYVPNGKQINKDLNKCVCEALKPLTMRSLLVIPIRLLEGVKLNE